MFEIVCALYNAYRPPQVYASSDDDEIIAEKMLALSKKVNELQKLVEDNNWGRKTVIWNKIEAGLT